MPQTSPSHHRSTISIRSKRLTVIRNKALACFAVLLALAPSLCNAQTSAGTYTVAASNVTMPSSGTTSIPFTLTSVNGFVGNLDVGVTAPTVPPGVKLPYLEIGGPVHLYPLTANGTLAASIGVLSAVPVPIPVKFNLPQHPSSSHSTVWSLAGIGILFLGLRRRRAAAPVLLALVLLLGLTTFTACGGPPTLTPGTYTYTLTASQVGNSQNMGTASSVSTTFTLTVPPGIVTK